MFGTGLVILGTMGLFTFNNTKKILQQFVEKDQFELSKQTMTDIDRGLYDYYSNIQVISKTEPFASYLSGKSSDKKEIDKELSVLINAMGLWNNLVLADNKGTIISSAKPLPVGFKLTAGSPSYLAYSGAVAGSNLYYSDLVISDIDHRPTVIFSAPIVNDEKSGSPVVGTIIGYYNWDTVLQILKNINIFHAHIFNLQGMLLATNQESDYKYILSSNYKYFSNNELAEFNKSGNKISQSNEDSFKAFISYYPSLGYKTFKGNNWELFLEMPTNIAFASAQNAAVMLTVLVGLIIFVTTFVTLLVVSREILVPINKLTHVARTIAQGDFATRAEIKSDDEIGMLADSFNKMTDYLVNAQKKEAGLNKLKDEFLSIASHELRTPMSAIKGLVSMILDGDYGAVNNNLKSPLGDVQLSTDRLIHLVNDMLDISRIEAGKLKFSLSDLQLSKAVHEATDIFKSIASEKHIELVVNDLAGVTVQADPDKFQQIMDNLIGNAFKFTGSGSIKIYRGAEEDRVIIYVEDTGFGIAKEDRMKLFNKFQQLFSQASGKPSGSGLGLYISKQIAQKMGGDLWIVKSEVGHGSTFAFSVPVSGSLLAANIKKTLEDETKELLINGSLTLDKKK